MPKRLPFRRPTLTSSTPASPRLSTPNSIRTSSDLLITWQHLSMIVERLILTKPPLGRAIVDACGDLLKSLHITTTHRRTEPT